MYLSIVYIGHVEDRISLRERIFSLDLSSHLQRRLNLCSSQISEPRLYTTTMCLSIVTIMPLISYAVSLSIRQTTTFCSGPVAEASCDSSEAPWCVGGSMLLNVYWMAILGSGKLCHVQQVVRKTIVKIFRVNWAPVKKIDLYEFALDRLMEDYYVNDC